MRGSLVLPEAIVRWSGDTAVNFIIPFEHDSEQPDACTWEKETASLYRWGDNRQYRV